jgi:hypothetical protein
MSFTAELKALPVLVTIVSAPLVVDKLTLVEPEMIDQVVDAPAADVNVIAVSYCSGFWPENHHTVVGPLTIVFTVNRKSQVIHAPECAFK